MQEKSDGENKKKRFNNAWTTIYIVTNEKIRHLEIFRKMRSVKLFVFIDKLLSFMMIILKENKTDHVDFRNVCNSILNYSKGVENILF